MPNSLSLWRRARFGMLLIPALLGGCYVVPVVPVQRPIYGPGYDRPYPRPYYRGYYRVGDDITAHFSAQMLDHKPVAGKGRRAA